MSGLPVDAAPPAHVVSATRLNHTRTLYKLSTPVVQVVLGVAYITDHVIASSGNAGDTVIFPANSDGTIADKLALWMDDTHVEHGEAVRTWLGGQA